ncbi:regulacin-like (variant) [Frankliniella occidentalis]|uniref:Regucalcin n=1 Tax=Frankliniella occidentalis TaxID=133901 RepID=A0A6J1S6C6_FRAOC|nr:regucalcin [Frankliniella occidentalis]KAE8742989.1 regulacin-like (variant) [Frankliniella occidentalis]
MAPVVAKVCEPVTLGEGPHWDAASKSLYYVDIEGKKLMKYVPATKERTAVTLDDLVGFAVPVDGRPNVFVAGLKRRIVLVTWDGRSETPEIVENLLEVQKDVKVDLLRINDGKADPNGRIWAGTMSRLEVGAEDGVLFYVSQDRKAHVRQTNVGLSNGLAWTPDGKTMYYVDSLKKSVDVMSVDVTSGQISDRKTLFSLEANGIHGFPDGMTIDTEGKLWVAVYDGAKVLRIDPATGTLMSTLDIPAPEVTSVAFGGDKLDELYVTTAAMRATKEVREKYPDAGALFRVTGLGVKGYAGVAAKI